MLLYANSMYDIMNKDFKKALTLLCKINFNNFLDAIDDNLYFKTDIKRYTLICMYELGYFENALIQIDSYKHYLNYTRIIPGKMKKKNINFLNLLTELIKINHLFDEFKLHKLKIKILNASINDITYREWFLKKISEFNFAQSTTSKTVHQLAKLNKK